MVVGALHSGIKTFWRMRLKTKYLKAIATKWGLWLNGLTKSMTKTKSNNGSSFCTSWDVQLKLLCLFIKINVTFVHFSTPITNTSVNTVSVTKDAFDFNLSYEIPSLWNRTFALSLVVICFSHLCFVWFMRLVVWCCWKFVEQHCEMCEDHVAFWTI